MFGTVNDGDIDDFVTSLWCVYTGFSPAVGENSLRRYVRGGAMCAPGTFMPQFGIFIPCALIPSSKPNFFLPHVPFSACDMQAESIYVVRRGFGPLQRALDAGIQRFFDRFNWIRRSGGHHMRPTDVRVLFQGISSYALCQALWRVGQGHRASWKLERVRTSMDGIQLLEYHCSGAPRTDSTSRNRCRARLVAAETAPDEWDVVTHHAGEEHNHAIGRLPTHPFMLTDVVTDGKRETTYTLLAKARMVKQSCEKLLEMPPMAMMTEEEECEYADNEGIPDVHAL